MPRKKLRQIIVNVADGFIELLPATGGAVEDLTNRDDTKRDDTKFSSEHLNVDTFLEGPTPNWTYKEISPIYKKKNHIYKYFLKSFLKSVGSKPARIKIVGEIESHFTI